jgi:hypothetical protein
MGLKNAGSYFQSQMTTVIGNELLYNGVEVYLMTSSSMGLQRRKYLSNLKKLLARFATFEYAIPKEMQIRSHEVGRHVINSKGTLSLTLRSSKCLTFPNPCCTDMKGFIAC